MDAGNAICIIHASGHETDSPLHLLQSLTFQEFPLKLIVVVSGEETRKRRVQKLCDVVQLEAAVLSTRSNTDTAAASFNVGLEHCYENEQCSFVVFLKRKELLYPCFSRVVRQAFFTSAADVVYAWCNYVGLHENGSAGTISRTPFDMLGSPSLSLSSVVVRFETLQRGQFRFDERVGEGAGSHFIVSRLQEGDRFNPMFLAIAECEAEQRNHIPSPPSTLLDSISAETRGAIAYHRFLSEAARNDDA